MDLMSMTIFSRMPQLTILLKPLGVATLADRSVDGFNRPQIWAQDMGPRSCLAWTSRRGRCLHASTTPLINALQFWLAHALWRAQFPRSEPHLPRSEPHRPKRRCSCGARSGAPNDDSNTKGCLPWETIAAPPFVEERAEGSPTTVFDQIDPRFARRSPGGSTGGSAEEIEPRAGRPCRTHRWNDEARAIEVALRPEPWINQEPLD